VFYDTLSAHTVKITLTRQDMSDYSIRSESLRSRSAESKRSLTRFLKRFQAESALFPDKSADRLFLEAFPSADGGCVMYVSTLGVEPLPDNEEPLPAASLMCFAENLADLSGLCAGISDRIRGSSLYKVSGGWCLIITAERSEMPYISRLAGEYGEYSDDALDISCAAEHGSAVCRENAAAMLSELA
jgi:negative regulator of genetic competence, sporulation and motility